MATTKKELLLDLLGRAWVYLQVNGNAPGVDLPDWLRTPSVTLQIGYNMPVPIHDLAVDDWGVTATLSFRRTPHTCRIPWAAIFALADGDGGGILFPEDVPAELQEAIAAAESAAARKSDKSPVTADLAPIPPNTPAPDAAPAAPPPADKPPLLKSGKPRPSHLKLV